MTRKHAKKHQLQIKDSTPEQLVGLLRLGIAFSNRRVHTLPHAVPNSGVIRPRGWRWRRLHLWNR